MNAIFLLCISLFLACNANAERLIFTTEDTPPFNYLNQDKKTIAGIGFDVVEQMLKRTGLQASITAYPWLRAYKMAATNKNTCVFSTTRMPQREALFKWVGPLVKNTWVLYGRHDTKISLSKLEDAMPLVIGGYRGDAVSVFLTERGFKVENATNDKQNLRKLNAGRIDLWASGILIGPYAAAKQGIKVKPLIFFNHTELYLACNASVPDDAINKMNAAIKAMRDDGTIDRINRRY